MKPEAAALLKQKRVDLITDIFMSHAVGFEPTTADDVRYGIPVTAHTHVLFYNRTLVETQLTRLDGLLEDIRLTLTVGVGYDSDMREVEQVLLKTAYAHKHVLREPATAAAITGFGDSSVDWELRVWIDNADYKWEVTNDINRMIFDALRENDIEIP